MLSLPPVQEVSPLVSLRRLGTLACQGCGLNGMSRCFAVCVHAVLSLREMAMLFRLVLHGVTARALHYRSFLVCPGMCCLRATFCRASAPQDLELDKNLGKMQVVTQHTIKPMQGGYWCLWLVESVTIPFRDGRRLSLGCRNSDSSHQCADFVRA